MDCGYSQPRLKNTIKPDLGVILQLGIKIELVGINYLIIKIKTD